MKLNATKLRKHLATSTSNLPEKQQKEISDFMGHGIEIHNDIYKQRVIDNDILTLGKILIESSGLESQPTEPMEIMNKENIQVLKNIPLQTTPKKST